MRAKIRSLYLSIAGTVAKVKPGVHVLNSHYVVKGPGNKKTDEILYENYIKYLLKLGKIENLEDAIQRINKKQVTEKDTFITLTYDDGFEECYTTIAPILEKYGCRGTFFINANYIESDEIYREKFNQRIHNTDKRPMTWNQILELHKRGHNIGSHGLDHINLGLLNEKEIEDQVADNKRILEEKLNYTCEYFAWPYGQLKDLPEKALEITSKYHPYIFSGTNWKNYFSYNGQVINRRHQEPFWKKSHIKYFLSVKKLYNK